jgi:hypothetical protein
LEGQTFDSIARAVAAAGSRRRLLRGIVAGGAAVLAHSSTPASAEKVKVAVCKPTGSPSNPFVLVELPWHAAQKQFEKGGFEPYDCAAEPTCEPCCAELDLPCSSDADCCSENCRDNGFCGGPCYCFDYYDPDEQAAKGPMCGASSGGLCDATQPGCLSSADCGGSFTECVIPDGSCNASGGMCAYTLSPCDE